MNELFKKEKRFSRFDGIVECLLLEGLITSYDIKKLQKTLKQTFGKQIKIIPSSEGEFANKNFDYHAYTFVIDLKNVTRTESKEFEKQITPILKTFGYFINHKDIKPIINQSKIDIRYDIEPKHPIKINDILKSRDIEYFYHITPTSKVSKIKKIGLAPKGSETNFRHPGDRIYLVSAETSEIKHLKKLLASHKHLKPDEMTVFKTPFNNKYNYFLDDVATQKRLDLIAVFVLKNIPPNELEIIDL